MLKMPNHGKTVRFRSVHRRHFGFFIFSECSMEVIQMHNIGYEKISQSTHVLGIKMNAYHATCPLLHVLYSSSAISSSTMQCTWITTK